jgi:hypothetical protein
MGKKSSKGWGCCICLCEHIIDIHALLKCMSISLLLYFNTWLMGPQHHKSLRNSQHSGKVLDLAFTSKTLGNLSWDLHIMYFLTVTFPYFLFLFQNRIAIFKQTWHNATLRSNKEPRLSSSKETLMTFKCLVF